MYELAELMKSLIEALENASLELGVRDEHINKV